MEPGPEPVPALDATQLGLTGQNAIWPADHWWQRYGDSQLDALVDEALANSPSMSSAQARLAPGQCRRQHGALVAACCGRQLHAEPRAPVQAVHLPCPLGGSVVISDNRLALDFSYELISGARTARA